MYNGHITQPSVTKTPKPLSIRLDPMPFNEQAAFVESVCAALIESRFGPGRSVTLNYRRTEQPETEPEILNVVTYEYTVGSCVTPFDPKIVRSSTVNAIRLPAQQFEHACIAVRFQNLSPPNQGRGSP